LLARAAGDVLTTLLYVHPEVHLYPTQQQQQQHEGLVSAYLELLSDSQNKEPDVTKPSPGAPVALSSASCLE